MGLLVDKNFREYIFLPSGFVLLILSVVLWKYFKIDPIDEGLIVNEQSIVLSTQFTNSYRPIMYLEDFLEEIRGTQKQSNYFKQSMGTQDSRIRANMSKNETLRLEEDVILKRWESPSIVKALGYPNVIRMLIYQSVLFFKYRIVNKRMLLYLESTYS
jgi:hypothetical protein